MSAVRRAMLLMIAFSVLWVCVEMLALRLSNAYSPYQVVWTRYAVHLAFMLAVWGRRDPAALWRTRRPVFHGARSLLMLGMPASFVMARDAGVDPATLLSIFWLAPLLILVFARLFLHEQVSALVWIAAVAGCAGAVLVLAPGKVPEVPLLALPLGMAATFSLYVVMTRTLRGEAPHVNLFCTALGVFVVLAPFMPHVWVTPDVHDAAVFAGIGLLGYATLLALDRLAAAAPVSVTAPLAYVQIPVTVTIASLLGRQQQPLAVLGAAMISIFAVVLLIRAPRIDIGTAA